MYRKIVLATLLSCVSALVGAETGDLDKPIEVSAGPCRMEKAGVQRCSGGVTITQGSMILKAEQVELRQDAEDNLYVQCEGAPVTFRQKLDSGEWVDAQALRINYDGKKKLLQLQGKAVVKRGQEVAAAELLSYDMANEVAESAGKGEGRTRIVIQPKKKQAAQ